MKAIVILLVAVLCCGSVHAQVPREINYQGYLTAPGGTPVNATVKMVFSLYNVAVGGTALYSETQNSVTVTNGTFNALIGSVSSIPGTVLFDVPYWLGVTVETDAEMTPRQPIAASAYAIRSASAGSLAVTATVPAAQIIGAVSSATSFTGALAGDVTGTQSATIIAAPTVTSKVLTGFTSAAGAITAGDSVLTAIDKLDGNSALKAPLASPTFTGTVNAANLTVSGNIALPATSSATVGVITKGGNRFLHNFGSNANTFLGENAGNFSLLGVFNTAIGSSALGGATTGEWNTASGFQALVNNQDGSHNTANGMQTLFSNVSGNANTAIGLNALINTTGSNNIGLGAGAGGNLTTGNYNIDIGNTGVAAEGNTIRIGDSNQTRTFIAGIRAVAPGNADGLPVVIDSAGQLGTGTGKTPYKGLIVVAKSGGDYTTIGAALASIVDASASNRYLVYVAPGTYAEAVTMLQYVDIQGAGELATKITAPGGPFLDAHTVQGASNAELRFLTVENTGGNQYASAIYNGGASPRLTHVTANALGGTQSYGVNNRGGSSPMMTNVTASAVGGTFNNGVFNASSSPTMTNVTASASGGSDSTAVGAENGISPLAMTNVTASASGGTTSNTGVYFYNATMTMTNVAVSVSGGGTSTNYGVHNYELSFLAIKNSTISASGGTSSYGILNQSSGGAGTVTVNNSQVSGSTNTIYNNSNFTTRVGASQLSGGAAVVNSGTLTCAGVYDENFAFFASTCP